MEKNNMAKNKDVEGEHVPVKVYTGIVTLGKAYSVLKDVGIDFLLTGKWKNEVDIDMIRKQASGEEEVDKDLLAKEVDKLNNFIFEVVDKLLLPDNSHKKLIEFYEIITKTDTTLEDDTDIEVILEAISNFFFVIVKKVPKYLVQMMAMSQGLTNQI